MYASQLLLVLGEDAGVAVLYEAFEVLVGVAEHVAITGESQRHRIHIMNNFGQHAVE